MDFDTIYKKVRIMWPDTVDISDGRPTGGDGYYFGNLNLVLTKIEDTIDSESDRWANVGVWAFFQAIHEEAKELHKTGVNIITINNVSKMLINQYIIFNLQYDKDDDYWEIERNEYRGL